MMLQNQGLIAQTPITLGLKKSPMVASLFNSLPPPESTRFGCRMMAFVVPENAKASAQLDQFHRHCLTESRESLKSQSKPNRPPRDGIKNPFTIEDLSGVLRQRGNPHGWGLVAAPSGKEDVTLNIHKSPLPAFESSGSFDEAVNQMLKTSPKMVLAHIRLAATQCKEVVTVNNHPFQHEKWNFMHNGIVTGAFQPTIQNALQEMYPSEGSLSTGYSQALPIKGPKGTTDSEACLYYWMGLMQKKYGSVDSQVVGKAQVRQSFADAIHDLIQASPPIYSDLKGSVLNIQGKIQVAPSMNFVASDGNLLLAFRKGAKLYLGMRRLPGQPAKSLSSQEYILSSEPIQPGKGFARIQWLDIPEEMILTLSRGASGAIEPELYPLSFFKHSSKD